MGKVVLRDGSAPHSDCSSADQAILNSASFDAKHERRWWYPSFLDHFGGICMYLQGIQCQRSDDFRGGGQGGPENCWMDCTFLAVLLSGRYW